jgi:quercetin dioxygenase-like cupin family protein
MTLQGTPAAKSAGTWGADAPPAIAFQLARLEDADWQRAPGALAALELRDLRLAAASNGALGAWHARVATDSASEEIAWHAHDLDFDFLFVLAGSVEIAHERGEAAVTLRSTDAAMIPAQLAHRAVVSRDFEAIIFTAPGDLGRLAGAGASSTQPAGWWSADAPRYLQHGEQAFERRGLRSFFSYRDLSTDEPTAGRVHASVLRATEAQQDGTGWHFHSMGQLVFVLSGVAEVNIAGHGTIVTGPQDSMCVGAGVAHNVHSFSRDYQLIEFCIPTEYETVAVELI